jgi:hypothetical protein
MPEIFHTYDTEELSNTTPSSIDFNWNTSNYLSIAYVSDTNVGVYETKILSFKNKFCALHYFRNFLDSIKAECPDKNLLNKISEIDNSINSIIMRKTDENIDLQIVNFEFDYISLSTDYSGYWHDASKLILKEIFDEIDSFFDFQYEDEMEEDYSITLNSDGSTTSLRKIQADCKDLLEYKDLDDQFFINKFYELCQSMNQFWDEL